MAAVTAALVGVFAFIILRVTAPQMSPVFTDLTPEDSAAIVKDLERQAIPYELKNDGAIVMVPRDRMTRIRMKLAEGGLPKGGGVGYEIFDKSDTLGATSFVQNINHLRALEGELARTIKAIDRVQAARVHLVLPERPLFSRDKVEPSASIVLRVRGALEAQQVRAIRHLVASAVNGLKPQRVSIVDEAGTAARRRRRERRHRRHRRLGGGAPGRLRAAAEGPDRVDRLLGGRARPRARAALRRVRLQPHHRDARQVRSGRPRAALEPDARGAARKPAARKARSRSATSCRAASRTSSGQQGQPAASDGRRSATRARSRRKSSITRSPARPRRR